MRITVIRTGGFAGLTRRATVETADRPDAEELAQLADQAVREGLSEAPTGVPDGFHYEVDVATDQSAPPLTSPTRSSPRHSRHW